MEVGRSSKPLRDGNVGPAKSISDDSSLSKSNSSDESLQAGSDDELTTVEQDGNSSDVFPLIGVDRRRNARKSRETCRYHLDSVRNIAFCLIW